MSGMTAFMGLVMLYIDGKDRTKWNFECVLDQAGLQLDAINPPGYESGIAIMEASVK